MRLIQYSSDMVVAGGFMAPTGRCYPSNNLLRRPLAPVMEDVAGAAGGLIWIAAAMMIVIFVLLAIFTIKSFKAQEYIKGIVGIVVVVFGGMIVLAVLSSAFNWGNSSICPGLWG